MSNVSYARAPRLAIWRRAFVLRCIITVAAVLAAFGAPAVRAADDEQVPLNARFLAFARAADAAGMTRTLKEGAAVNSRNRLGETALVIVLKQNRVDLATMLVGAGADVNLAAINGITPLMAAAYGGHTEFVAVLLDKGADNPTLHAIWSNLPKQKEKEVAAPATIDAATLLPADKGYYTFQGSLTTPPCSEGVRWFVLKTPMTLAANELTAFAKLYPMNARPTQPLNGRAVEATR